MSGYILQFILSICVGIFVAAILQARGARRAVMGGVAGFATLLTLGITLTFVSISARPVSVRITLPQNGHEVPERTLATGVVQQPEAAIRLLVRPIELDSWWVQEIPIVQRDGTWSAYVNIGAGNAGIGKSFEIIALATVESQAALALRGGDLKAGQQLKTIPSYFAKSIPVVVLRQAD